MLIVSKILQTFSFFVIDKIQKNFCICGILGISSRSNAHLLESLSLDRKTDANVINMNTFYTPIHKCILVCRICWLYYFRAHTCQNC